MAILLIFIPLLGIILLNLHFRRGALKSAFWMGLAVLLYQMVSVVLYALNLISPQYNPLEKFFVINPVIDNLSLVALLSIAICCLSGLFAANVLIEGERKRFNFVNLLLLLVIGMNGLVLVRDLFTLIVFLEISSIAAFVLVAFDKYLLGLEGAFKYFLFSSLATVFMLSSMSFILMISGSTGFDQINASLLTSPYGLMIKISLSLFILGVLIKCGSAPFHAWVADVYTGAPAYVSILLGGIVTKITGVYVLMRLVISVFGINFAMQNMLLFVGLFSILLGAILALKQDQYRRMLAYSSVSQIGYIVLGLACATPLGLFAAIFHFFNHMLFKTALFGVAAGMEHQIKDRENVSGLSQYMPVTSFVSLVALLSTAGIPPLSGFWSKFLIVFALYLAGFKVYAAMALLASILTLGYVLRFERKLFWGQHQIEQQDIKESSLAITLPALALAIGTILIGAAFPVLWVIK